MLAMQCKREVHGLEMEGDIDSGYSKTQLGDLIKEVKNWYDDYKT